MLRINTWNFKGINYVMKEREVLKVTEDAGVDACGLAEKKWKGGCVREWECGIGVCVEVDENARAREGVGTVVSNT